MGRIEELCGYYTAFLRCLYLQHQNAHWLTHGNDFYGNHLLFERIYKSAAENADLAAEKFIGLFGLDTIDPHSQAQMIGKILEKYSSDKILENSLAMEQKFLSFSEKFYSVVEKDGKMSLGLDDMIMHIASNREGAVYLLKQASGKTNEMTADSKVVARTILLKRIKNAQNINDIQNKLKLELTALVVSEAPGQYDMDDIRISIDIPSKKIFGNVKLHSMLPQATQTSIEKVFTDFAYNILPIGMKDFVVGVGFAMIRSV
jgi:DNA-binding ferritin-like protein